MRTKTQTLALQTFAGANIKPSSRPSLVRHYQLTFPIVDMTYHPPKPYEAAVVPEKAGLLQQPEAPPDPDPTVPQDPAVPLLLALAQSNSNLDAADAAVFVRFTEEKIPLVQRISIIEALRSGRWGAWRSDPHQPYGDDAQPLPPRDLEKADPQAQPATPSRTRRRPRHGWPVLLMAACLLLAGAAFVYVDLYRCHATKQFLCLAASQSRVGATGSLPRYQALG